MFRRYHGRWNIILPDKNVIRNLTIHGPLTRYAKLWVAHAPGMPGTFSPRPRVSDPDMYHGTCVTHMPWRMLGSLTSGFLWCQWRGTRFWHSRRMRNPQFCISGKRPMAIRLFWHKTIDLSFHLYFVLNPRRNISADRYLHLLSLFTIFCLKIEILFKRKWIILMPYTYKAFIFQ